MKFGPFWSADFVQKWIGLLKNEIRTILKVWFWPKNDICIILDVWLWPKNEILWVWKTDFVQRWILGFSKMKFDHFEGLILTPKMNLGWLWSLVLSKIEILGFPKLNLDHFLGMILTQKWNSRLILVQVIGGQKLILVKIWPQTLSQFNFWKGLFRIGTL